MSHGLVNAHRAADADPGRCTRMFVPLRSGSDAMPNYRRACLCGQRKGHAGKHRCPDCGGQWGDE